MTSVTGDVLRLEDVGVDAGGATLLDGVTLSIPAGAIVAIVGPNGAGKTTLLDAISGVAVGARGHVTILGAGAAAGGAPRAGVGRVFQGSPLPATLTVAEVVALAAKSRSAAEPVLDGFGLSLHASTFVGDLSTGMRRILDLAIASIGRPAVLLLDEPSSGLAPAEVERLAALVLQWRDATGAAVVIAEHDLWLVQQIADEIVVLSSGSVAGHGPTQQMLARARPHALARLRSPFEPQFREALSRVAAGAVPAAPLVTRSISTWTLLRLGLREFAAGMSSVLILGVLNRVMKIELGISLGVVAAVLASYNLAAPFALAVGHRSDTHPIFGRRRTPYIMGGAILAGLAVAAAPHVAGRLAGGVGVGDIGLAVALFGAMGIGMYGAGTVFFALLADLAPERDRGHAASVIYLMLMGGILAGVALTVGVLDDDANGVTTLFALTGMLVVALTTIAVWGQERRIPDDAGAQPDAERVPFGTAIRGIAALPRARAFFLFMVAATLFLFLQQAVLEPFGGDLFGLDVRQTSAFNAVMAAGILAGMFLAGRPFAAARGHRTIARTGLAVAAVAFAGLALSAATKEAAPAWLSVLAVGFGTGLFNVASLALMMGMADRRHTALFMGSWTVAHAIADGLATAGGGAFYELARAVTGGQSGGYAVVFCIEAIGLLACIPLLRRFDLHPDAVPAARVIADAEIGSQTLVPDAPRGSRWPHVRG